MRQIVVELSDEHIERNDDLELIAITFLAAQHGCLVGDPGADKSRLVENFCGRLDGANYRRALMHRQLGEEALFGNFDLPKYDLTNVWERDMADTLGDGHVCLIDEPDKAGPAALMPLLTWLNERRVKPGKLWVPAPVISAFGAANALLDTSEGGMNAVWDRFLTRKKVHYIQEPGNYIRLLKLAVVDPSAPPKPHTTIALGDILPVITDVIPTIAVSDGIYETLAQLRIELFTEGVVYSDRRSLQMIRLLQASAWLNGRGIVEDDDLAILRHVLWEVDEQIPEVEKRVLSLTSPLTKAALEFEGMIQETLTQLDSLAGKALEEKASWAGTANFELSEVADRLKATLTTAEQQGRSTVKLELVKHSLVAARERVFVEAMNTPADRARVMAEIG